MADTAWRPLAEHTREALDLLGYGTPRCLPGEPEACGGDYAHHALAHLAALRAVVDHRIAHLGATAGPMVEEIRAATAATLDLEEPCDQPDHHPPTRPTGAPPG